jgi:hypothetical protein
MFGRDWEPTTATIVMARVRGVGGKTGPKNPLAGPDHIPTDAEMLAAWQAKQDHGELASEIQARGDISQLEAWTETSNDLSMALMHLTAARPDWKSPYQLTQESAGDQ